MLRDICGFDFLPIHSTDTTATNLKLDAMGYYVVKGQPSTANANVKQVGRFGGKCLAYDFSLLYNDDRNLVVCPAGGTHREGIFGLGMFVGPTNSADISQIFHVTDAVSNVRLVTAEFGAYGVIKVYRGQTEQLLGWTAAGTWTQNEWFWFECRVVIGNTDGEVEVRINTEEVLHLISVDTQPATATGAFFDSWGWGAIGWPTYSPKCEYYIDDIYFCDTTGTVNNTFLGNVRARTLATTGAGSSTQLTIYGPEATNWETVHNDAIDDTQYVYSSTVGYKDLYTITPSVPAVVVHGLQVRGAYRMDDATQRIARNLVKSGASTSEGDDHYLNQTFTYYRDIFELDPATALGWSGTAVNAAEIGPKVQA
jgi:hypothetical protein